MKTRIIDMINNKGCKIRLVGCCHTAKREYFEKLQSKVEGLVLYEGVKSENLNKISTLSKFYDFLKTMMDLEFQNDVIEYKEDWINSDLTEKQLNYFSNTINKLDSLNIKLESLTQKQLKLISKLAIRLISIGLKFKDKDSYKIVNLRNDKVILDIVKYVSENNNFISVLYGEAHLDDLVKKLKKLGFKVKSIEKIKVNFK